MTIRSRRPPPRPKRPSDVTKRELTRLYRTEGLSDAQIGEILGYSRQHVGQLRAQKGIPSRGPGRRPTGTTPEATEKRRVALLEAQQAYRREHADRLRARHRLDYALKTGKVERPAEPSCEHTNRRPLAYIPDLERPLEPEWLCRACVKERHESS